MPKWETTTNYHIAKGNNSQNIYHIRDSFSFSLKQHHVYRDINHIKNVFKENVTDE